MLLDFYRAVLPAGGHYCLFLLPEAQHVWADSIEDLTELTEKYQDRTGVYYGTTAFSEKSRKQVNVPTLRSLRLDIDCGAEKHERNPEGTYPSQDSGLEALLVFLHHAELRPTYVVSSGAGLHVYFCFDEDIPREQWQALAKALQQKCVAGGLLVDPTVTQDAARILRPLGALHDNGNRVKVLGQGKTTTAAKLTAKLNVPPPAPPARKYDLSINDDLIAKVEGPPSSGWKIAEQCAALKEIAASKGDVQEPQWRAMLGLVKFTVEGDELAHEWSMGHPDYDAAATQRKLDAYAAGPTTCAKFNEYTTACNDCPHKGKIKAPIVLGRMTIVEVEELPEELQPELIPPQRPTAMPWRECLPETFDVLPTADGHKLVQYITVDRDEDGGRVRERIEVPITAEIFWFSHWADAENSFDAAQVNVHKWDHREQRVKSFDIPTGLLAARTDLAKKLGEFGIQITTDKRALASMEAYAKAQFQRIKNLARRTKVLDRFGMRILDSGELVSVHGKYVIYGDGRIEEAMLGPKLREISESFAIPVPPSQTGTWDESVWDTHIMPAASDHVEFMKRNYSAPGMEKYQLAFMLGLASPLMAFATGSYTSGPTLPPNGLSVSLFEREGGRGKTTLMQCVALAYGNAVELTKDMNDQASTGNARNSLAALFGTMPVSMDEMGRSNEQAVANIISQIANGTSKSGSTKDMGLRATSRWALICLIGTNKSQREMITIAEEESSAVQYRLLELDVQNMPEFDEAQRDQFTAEWADVGNRCRGALGAALQRAICELGVPQANKLVLDCVSRASKLVGASQTGRFQYRGLGAMLAAQVLLSRMGFAMFNTTAMVEAFRAAHDAGNAYVSENVLPTNGLELLSMCLHDLRQNAVITEKQGRLFKNMREPAVALGSRGIPPKVSMRFIVETSTAYVAADDLRAWCRAKKVREVELLGPARNAGVLTPVYPSRLADPSQPTKFAATDRWNLLTGMMEDMKVLCTCYAFKVHRLAQILGPYVEQAMLDTEASNVVPMRPPKSA